MWFHTLGRYCFIFISLRSVNALAFPASLVFESLPILLCRLTLHTHHDRFILQPHHIIFQFRIREPTGGPAPECLAKAFPCNLWMKLHSQFVDFLVQPTNRRFLYSRLPALPTHGIHSGPNGLGLKYESYSMFSDFAKSQTVTIATWSF